MSSLDDPRVLFAAERTLLAWNRTSLGFIAFGFLVERAGLLEARYSAPDPVTFWAGLAFIALGVATTLHASRQFALVVRTLKPGEIPAGYSPQWGLWVNHAVALLGLALIVGLYLGRHSG